MLDIKSGDLTPAPDALQPSAPAPGVAGVTPIATTPSAADQMPARDLTSERLADLAAEQADITGAQSAGMGAENDRRAGYESDVLPVGSGYGTLMNLPAVPDNSTPPASSDLYPWPADEPVPAAAGMAGPYNTGNEPK